MRDRGNFIHWGEEGKRERKGEREEGRESGGGGTQRKGGEKGGGKRRGRRGAGRGEEEKERKVGERKGCEDRGRDWNDAAMSQGTLKNASKHQKLKEAKTKFPSRASLREHGLTLISECWPPEVR